MDARGRKRKRGRKKLSVADQNDVSDDMKTKAADLPTFRAQTALKDMATTERPSEAGLSVSSQGSDPRPFSSCSRLSTKRSPSPARAARQREHTELQVLNERLSSHADHVKTLQAENSRLRLQIEAMDGVIHRESRKMKQLHGSEIKTLQDLFDKCSEEKTALDKLYEEEKLERERLGAELWDKDAEIASLCDQLHILKGLSDDYQRLKEEFEATEAALKESREDVERINSELLKEKRSNRRLQEEAMTNKERYLKEVEEASARFNEHIHAADQKLEAGYETQVSRALSSLRQQHVRDLEGLRAEMTTSYQARISELKSACELAQADLLAVRREVKVARQEQDQSKDFITQLKADKAALEVQVKDTTARLEETRDRAERDRCHSQREIALFTQELAELREELDQMGGANSRLEAEINAYRLIVEDLEEQSFKVPADETKIESEVVTQTQSKSRKKKKTKEQQTYVAGRKAEQGVVDTLNIFKREDYLRTNEFSLGIEILDVDIDGRYITLVNTTDHPTDLCLWTVQQTDGQNTVKYELDCCTQLTKGRRLTIWSCDAGPGRGHHRVKADDQKRREKGAPPAVSVTRAAEEAEDDGAAHLGDGGTEGIQVTMAERQSWLKLDTSLTIRVEDGDGQLQAKCGISSIEETGSSKGSNSLSTAVSSSANTIPYFTRKSSSSSSNSNNSLSKRPRLGGLVTPSDNSSCNNNVARAHSETCFDKKPAPGGPSSSASGRGRSAPRNVGGKKVKLVSSESVDVERGQAAEGFQDRRGLASRGVYDKDSCVIA